MNGHSGGEDWRTRLKRDGYALFPRLCPNVLVDAARAAIDANLAANFDPQRQVEYDNISYCPEIRGAPELMALLLESGIVAKLEQAIGFDRLDYSQAQIALRHPGVMPGRERVGPPHIDGVPSGLNGVPDDVIVSNFTCLVGVHLSAAPEEFCGNFVVWPGSHLVLERQFRRYGLEVLRRDFAEMPLGEPVQLLTAPGDVVLCHYQLAHSWVANRAATTRCAIYFRLWFKDIEDYRFELLSDIWRGWRI